MDAGGSKALRPPHSEDQDEVSFAKEKNRKQEMKGGGTGQQQDFESGQLKYVEALPSSHSSEVSSTVDDLDESVGPGDGRLSPVPSVISMKSDWSMVHPLTFARGNTSFHRQHTEELESVVCAVCPKRAFKSCLTCVASFCGDHVKPHYTAPALQKHRLVEATEDLEQRLCQRHHRDLELYCRTDHTEICVLCMAVEHIGHDITVLELGQGMQFKTSVMEKKTAVPPPGPIEFTSVTPDSVCLCWGPPEGLTGPHRFRVSWTGEGNEGNLEVHDLKLRVQELTPGEKYTFKVTTLSDHGKPSSYVSSVVCTDIPPPECITVESHLTSVSVTWTKPAGVDQASYLLTLCSDGENLQTLSTRSLLQRFSELEIGREYTITISTGLKGNQSQPVSKTIKTKIPIPEKVTFDTVTPTSVKLSWALPEMLHQTPQSFLITYHSGETEPKSISANSCSTVITGLEPDTEYIVSVVNKLSKKKSQPASTTIHTASIPVPCGLTVDSLTAMDESNWTAKLSWSLPNTMDQTPHRFHILYHKEGDCIYMTKTVEECSTGITGLQPCTNYTAHVCTAFPEDRKSPSASITFYTAEMRLVLIGKTGMGKSSAGNTILNKRVFKVVNSLNSETTNCRGESNTTRGRMIKIVDTPGFFDLDVPEDTLKSQVASCIVECSPGPHAFIFLLKVDRFSKHEKETVEMFMKMFGENAQKNTVVLFTHGDDLNDDQTIDDYVHKECVKNPLTELVHRCGGRCHVIDNKRWNQEHTYRSNSVQVEKLLNTIENMVRTERGYYTNDFLTYVEEAIQRKMQQLPEPDYQHRREQARKAVEKDLLLKRFAGASAGLLLGALCGPVTTVASALAFLCGIPYAAGIYVKQRIEGGRTGKPLIEVNTVNQNTQAQGLDTKTTAAVGVGAGAAGTSIAAGVFAGLETGGAAAVGIGAAASCGIGAGVAGGVSVIAGAVAGATQGADKVRGAKSKNCAQAMQNAAEETLNTNVTIVKKAFNYASEKINKNNSK